MSDASSHFNQIEQLYNNVVQYSYCLVMFSKIANKNTAKIKFVLLWTLPLFNNTPELIQSRGHNHRNSRRKIKVDI